MPFGKFLFFPIVNCNWIHIPEGLPGADTKTTVDEVWDALQSPIDGCGRRDNASELKATVDGVDIGGLTNAATSPFYTCAGPKNKGCAAPAFNITLSTKNIFGLPAGTYGPGVGDGYYILLAPLRPGMHTLTWSGKGGVAGGAVGEFTQNITYDLKVQADLD
jgi:hypothetical protein